MKDIPTVSADKKRLHKQGTKYMYADRLFLAVKRLIVVKDIHGMKVFWNEAEKVLIQSVMEYSHERTITIDNPVNIPDVDS